MQVGLEPLGLTHSTKALHYGSHFVNGTYMKDGPLVLLPRLIVASAHATLLLLQRVPCCLQAHSLISLSEPPIALMAARGMTLSC